MGAPWRTDISKAYVSQIMTTNADGTVSVDYSQLEKLLNKNAEEMTDLEYQTVALVYVLSGDTFGEKDIDWYATTCGLTTTNKDVVSDAATKIGDFLIRKAGKDIPGFGDVLSIGGIFIGIGVDYTEIAAYKNVMKESEMRSLVRYLDLNAIRITDTTNQKSSVSYQISEGIGDSHGSTTSRQRLEKFHTNLSPGGDYESLARKIEYDSSQQPTLEEVLANPEVFMGYNEDIVNFDESSQNSNHSEKNSNKINVGDMYE